MTTAIERTDEKLVGPTRRREYITISDARCQDCAGTSQGEESAVAWAYEHSETMGHVVGQQVVNVRLWAPVDSDRVKVRTLEHVPACGEEEDCGCGVCHSAERSYKVHSAWDDFEIAQERLDSRRREATEQIARRREEAREKLAEVIGEPFQGLRRPRS